MLYLLNAAIGRIDSLFHFYSTERATIENKSKKGRKQNAFGFMLDTYLHILSSGSEQEKQTESFINMQDNIEKYVNVVDVCEQDGGKKVLYRLLEAEKLRGEGYETDPAVAAKKFRQFAEMPEIHSHNTLVMLITRFEEFISGLLSEIYYMFPQKYLDNKEIKFSEIIGIGIDEVRSGIVEREVDGVMRKSYEDWFDIFRSHNMNLSGCDTELKFLKEIYARRNIVVHNSGRVNASYLKVVPELGRAIGEKLYSDHEYIQAAFSTIKVIVYTISIEAARFLKEDKQRYLDCIFNMAFEELQSSNYTITANIFAQLANHKALDNNTKLLSRVNNWISRIEIDNQEVVRKEVEELDVSALDKSFLLAKYILTEDYQQAKVILDCLFRQQQITPHELETWPLFIHFKESEAYIQFRHEHSDAFEVSTVELGNMPSVEDTENAKRISANIDSIANK